MTGFTEAIYFKNRKRADYFFVLYERLIVINGFFAISNKRAGFEKKTNKFPVSVTIWVQNKNTFWLKNNKPPNE